MKISPKDVETASEEKTRLDGATANSDETEDQVETTQHGNKVVDDTSHTKHTPIVPALNKTTTAGENTSHTAKEKMSEAEGKNTSVAAEGERTKLPITKTSADYVYDDYEGMSVNINSCTLANVSKQNSTTTHNSPFWEQLLITLGYRVVKYGMMQELLKNLAINLYKQAQKQMLARLL